MCCARGRLAACGGAANPCCRAVRGWRADLRELYQVCGPLQEGRPLQGAGADTQVRAAQRELQDATAAGSTAVSGDERSACVGGPVDPRLQQDAPQGAAQARRGLPATLRWLQRKGAVGCEGDRNRAQGCGRARGGGGGCVHAVMHFDYARSTFSSLHLSSLQAAVMCRFASSGGPGCGTSQQSPRATAGSPHTRRLSTAA
mmetsp:Transcript_4775/g.14696  ORF Transcript_4775/g.14696 Transcript_4775/m.14696 type:complete len:201 (+) Transcript_4775:1192-1794(+)